MDNVFYKKFLITDYGSVQVCIKQCGFTLFNQEIRFMKLKVLHILLNDLPHYGPLWVYHI